MKKEKKEVRNEAEVIYKQLTNVFNQPPVKPFQVRVVDISPEELEESSVIDKIKKEIQLIKKGIRRRK